MIKRMMSNANVLGKHLFFNLHYSTSIRTTTTQQNEPSGSRPTRKQICPRSSPPPPDPQDPGSGEAKVDATAHGRSVPNHGPKGIH